ncbi:MAG: glycoside hydrolase family 3 C-terminal domain-containing protein [Acidobacteriota bacterium]
MALQNLLRRTPWTAMAIVAILAGPWCLGQTTPRAQGSSHPWMSRELTPDQRADLVIAQMTLDEKIQLVHGAGFPGLGETEPVLVRSNGGFGFVPGIERLGIPDLNLNDGTVGVVNNARNGRYSTALPSVLGLASSWNPKLAHDWGAFLGREFADQGYNATLGAGVNITREARNGRNFEYFGEDPILAGNMVAQWIQGVQSQGIIADIKHYAVNDQDTARSSVDAIIDERSMRETDLLIFEIGVKRGKPGMVMCSYNLVNGAHACQNDYLLNQVLKQEWGFQGFVISDWGATHSTVESALAGLDQEQPGGQYFSDALKKAVEAGEVPMSRLDDMVHRILRTEFATGTIDDPQPTRSPDVLGGFKIAQRAAEESIVLLKNANGLLPLDPDSSQSIAVIGGHADVGVLSGGGSAQVDPAGGNAVRDPHENPADISMMGRPKYHPSSPLAAIRKAAPSAQVTFDSGTTLDTAAATAKAADVAIVFVVQPTSEGGDLESLTLPDDQDELVSRVAAANPRTIVVVESGGPALMPWADRVSAIFEAWYPGIRGGQALAELLFGRVNPSAKLAVTFPKSESDLPHPKLRVPPGGIPSPMQAIMAPPPPFPVRYDEGLKVGYKWFDAENIEPLFPFGFGLSYTSYAYSDLKVTGGSSLQVSFTVRNTGRRAGKEIAQVYLSFPEAAGEPPKRLIGWQKVALNPGERKTVSLTVDPLYLSIFNATSDRWEITPGEYEVKAGPSSATLPLSAGVHLDGDAGSKP